MKSRATYRTVTVPNHSLNQEHKAPEHQSTKAPKLPPPSSPLRWSYGKGKRPTTPQLPLLLGRKEQQPLENTTRELSLDALGDSSWTLCYLEFPTTLLAADSFALLLPQQTRKRKVA
jgi:hypothetical protein